MRDGTLQWVITGGESGPSAPAQWRRSGQSSIMRQCLAEGVDFFFKQWGGRQGET